MLPQASKTITQPAMVILAIPPRIAAAPIKAYVPESATYPGNPQFNQWPIRRPKQAPDHNVGTTKPAGHNTPEVIAAIKK